MSTWTDDIVKALINLGGVASLQDIYSEIKRIRPNLSKTWRATVRERIHRHSTDSHAYNEANENLFYSVEGLGAGIWGLWSYLKMTPLAIDIDSDEKTTVRIKQETYRVLRDTQLVRKLKLLHENKCQICGRTIKLPDGRYYSEGHHLIPVGQPHNGPDIAGNIIILCPNHHVMCDYGVIELNNLLLINRHGHVIEKVYLDYHNQNIFKSCT